jgi:hypothetical protein
MLRKGAQILREAIVASNFAHREKIEIRRGYVALLQIRKIQSYVRMSAAAPTPSPKPTLFVPPVADVADTEALTGMLASMTLGAAGGAGAGGVGASVAPAIVIPEKIPELDRICEVLSNPAAQRDLVTLYSDSQSECKRNGKCTMEIGSSREKDLLAVLKRYIGDGIKTDLDNALVEDFRYNDQRISVKHSSDVVGGGNIKMKWTADQEQANACIRAMLELKPDHYTHILLMYIRVETKCIDAIMVSADTVLDIVRTLGLEAFKSSSGTNNRGINYSKKTLQQFIKRAYFHVKMTDAGIEVDIDPIDRRIAGLGGMMV